MTPRGNGMSIERHCFVISCMKSSQPLLSQVSFENILRLLSYPYEMALEKHHALQENL